jgi:N utilization substance protein B
MMNRSKAREFALQILYEIDSAEKDPAEAFAQFFEHFESSGRAPGQSPPDASLVEFTKRIVMGVAEHRDALDALVEKASINWRLDRMPRVDRNVLRLAAWELSKTDDVPMKVVINEAIELAKRFGAEDSGSFVNGILDKLANEVGRT